MNDLNFETVRFETGLGFMPIEVSKRSYRTAQEMATMSGQMWFIGVDDAGREHVNPRRSDLLDMGCQQVAWVQPLRASEA